MPSYISRTNLVLIPKGNDPCQVGDYRPISVCNVIYKVISKILTSRLKPYVAECISNSQSAFVPGREISENVILLREVLHSFNSINYTNADFCLKVDLSKAFDRMDWGFLESILPLYGIPHNMCTWIMACVRSAEFTIVMNGNGGGFFRPESGLRQGYSLSPYLFIFGMDILSRSLSELVNQGRLRGVKLAPSCEPITNCLYADDLLIFGKADEGEANQIVQALTAFSKVSGQVIGPAKSTIWFSRITQQRDRDVLAGIFNVQQSAVCKSYLGAPIGTKAQDFDFLIEAVSSRLQT